MSKPSPIRAILRPVDLAQHLFEVELTFPAEAMVRGGVAAMPAWTPGSYLVRDYARFVDRVRVLDGQKERPLDKLDKQRWQLPASTRDLTIRYRVYGNDLTVRTNHVDATHAQIIPAATFLYLEGQLDRPVEVRFEKAAVAGQGVVALRVALLDGRLGDVRWIGTVRSDPAPTYSRAVLTSLAAHFADLFTAP